MRAPQSSSLTFSFDAVFVQFARRRWIAYISAFFLAVAGLAISAWITLVGLALSFFTGWSIRRAGLMKLGNAQGPAEAAQILASHTGIATAPSILILLALAFSAGVATGRIEPVLTASLDYAAAQQTLIDELKREFDAEKVDLVLRRFATRAEEFVDVAPAPADGGKSPK
jgi:hypothetical protein